MLGDSLRLLAAGVLLPSVLGCGKNESNENAESSPRARSQPETPAAALAELRDGNRRFTTQRPLVRTTSEIEHIWTEITLGQRPFATVLGCADSRLAPELIFDQFFGDVFVVREAGNIAASPTSLGSLEYAQSVLGSKLLVVLGHTSYTIATGDVAFL